MSGSGGGGGGAYGGGGDDCSTLKFDAQLASPQPGIVSTLALKERLSVRMQERHGLVVVEVMKGVATVGGLAGPMAVRLRQCMEQGHEFEAIVTSVDGGQVRVRIEHA